MEICHGWRTVMRFLPLLMPLMIFPLSTSAEIPPEVEEEEYLVDIPGLDEYLPVPEDNPMTDEKVALGHQLYFDPRLSADGTVSCATCHHPDKGWADGEAVSTGIGGQTGARSAPTVINTAYNLFQFWDGRAPSLEEQALGPIENPIEMGSTLEEAVKTLSNIPGYRKQFESVFEDGVTAENIGKAIAAFERTVLSGNSPWDRFEMGDKSAMSESAQRGLELFRSPKGNCNACHAGFNLTDGVFHNLGVGIDAEEPDLGRWDALPEDQRTDADKGAFKTPTLRDIALTAPYMHDGSEETLEQVIEFYVKGGNPNPWIDKEMKPLDLSEQETKDLLAFLLTLTGETRPDGTPPELPADEPRKEDRRRPRRRGE